jgi:hypothetical protein
MWWVFPISDGEAIILLLMIILSIWKIVDIIMWLFTHVSIGLV